MFLSPWDIEQRTGITDGAIRHLDVVPGQFLGQRLGYETPLANFYLCGGGTHPGVAFFAMTDAQSSGAQNGAACTSFVPDGPAPMRAAGSRSRRRRTGGQGPMPDCRDGTAPAAGELVDKGGNHET